MSAAYAVLQPAPKSFNAVCMMDAAHVFMIPMPYYAMLITGFRQVLIGHVFICADGCARLYMTLDYRGNG